MNNFRRKRLEQIAEALGGLMEYLETVTEEETEYRDNIPENLHGSDRYSKAEMACDSLENAVSAISDAIDEINAAQE